MKTLIRSSDRCAFMVIIDTLPLLHHDISARYISRYNVHALPTADRSLQHRRSDVRACARAPVARLCVEDHPVKTVSVSAGVFAYDGKHARECPGIPDSYFSLADPIGTLHEHLHLRSLKYALPYPRHRDDFIGELQQ